MRQSQAMHKVGQLVTSSSGRRRRPLPSSWRGYHAGTYGSDGSIAFPSSWWNVRSISGEYNMSLFPRPFSIRKSSIDVRRWSSFQPNQEMLKLSSTREWNQQATRIILKQESTRSVDGQQFSQDDMQTALYLLQELGCFVREEKGGKDKNHHALLVDEDPAHDVDIPVEPLDAALAWSLLETVTSSSQEEDPSLYGTLSSSNILHSVLQLWRRQLVDLDHHKKKNTKLPDPQAVLERFDDWRTSSSGSTVGLVVDVQCYNILLAAAGSLGQHDLCYQVYHWMWEESTTDSLVQPDRVTLRAMLRSIVQRGSSTAGPTESVRIHAAEECERLVQDYLSRNKRLEDIATIYQSLLHIWARADPTQARLYLRDMANNHLRYRTDIGVAHMYPPPRTLDWNQVISSLAIQHGQPAEGAEVLNDFQVFSSTLRDLISSEFETAAEQSLILSNAHTKGQQELRLSQIPQPDLVSFNSLLEGYARVGDAEQANRLYDSILSGKYSVRPNIVTFTSAIKANHGDWTRVQTIAHDCLGSSRELNQQDSIVVDATFFHAWLQACLNAVQSGNGRSEALVEAESILKEIMPSSGIQPTKLAYQFFLKCFIVQDDLEGATQWLLKNLRTMDEATILEWTLALSQKGDIELMSFLDKFTMRTPKTLLQVLIQDGYLESSNVLEYLLRNIPVDQGLQVLEWLRPELRTLKCFAIVIRSLSESSSADDAKRLEDLWEIAQEQTTNRMQDEATTSDSNATQTVGEIYTSLIVAWSKAEDTERVRAWWNDWTKNPTLMKEAPPTAVAQTAVLACLAATFQPNQAQQFLDELFVMYRGGQLVEPPDVVMLNLVLKAWLLSANGHKAANALQIGKEKYGMDPDVISYNTVVQAYVKGRQLDQAFAFVRDHRDAAVDFPNVTTIRSILLGWSRHRQDYELASKESNKIWKWVLELHSSGVWKIDPRSDPGIKTILEDLKHRLLQQRKRAKNVDTRGGIKSRTISN